MKSYLLPTDQLKDWLRRVQQERRLIAPVPDADGVIGWREVADPSQIVLEPGVPNLPPKEVFLPLTEVLFRYGYSGPRAAVGGVPEAPEPFAVFGMRPCDAYAQVITDQVYLDNVPDPYYQARREAGLLIAVNCTESVPECFCASLNEVLTEAPGADVLLTPLNGDYLLEGLTDEGEALLEQTAGHLALASEEHLERKAEVAEQTAGQQTRRVDLEGLTERVREAYHDEDFWKKHAEACVGCGVCTFLCPTCICFDVRDDAISGRGLRYRCWDTCQFADFSREASGHDPRAEQWQRQRNRISHKFWYSVDRGGDLSCVGCGRCLRGCAGHTDLVAVLEDLRNKPVTANES